MARGIYKYAGGWLVDWTASGIKNTFRYQLVDARTLEPMGWLDGVTGGKLTEGYRSDYRVSASLDVDNCEIPLGTAVRIWHDAQLGDETFTEVMATLFPEPDANKYELGRWAGTIDLHSAMKRLATDKRANDRSIEAGTNVQTLFESIVRGSGGVPWVQSFLASVYNFSGSHIWQHDESVLTECNRCADACSGWIGVDTYGRVCLLPYQLPSARIVSFDIQPATLFLVGFQKQAKEICNCVFANYEKDNVVYSARAVVPAAHPWSFERIGRWEAVKANIDGIDTNATGGVIQTALNAKVQQQLASRSDVSNTYAASILYTPDVTTGAVGDIWYQDSPDDEGIRMRAFVSGRDITLDAAMTTELTLEEVL